VISGFAIALMMVLFLGLWSWAWSKRRQADFIEAAQLPLIEQAPRRPEDPQA
jgi:cbb3-type cytochrome oxidase subunit 3